MRLPPINIQIVFLDDRPNEPRVVDIGTFPWDEARRHLHSLKKFEEGNPVFYVLAFRDKPPAETYRADLT